MTSQKQEKLDKGFVTKKSTKEQGDARKRCQGGSKKWTVAQKEAPVGVREEETKTAASHVERQ